MAHNDIGLWTALIAGFASFISPCVLPLVPAYLSFMSGVSLSEMKEKEQNRKALGKVFLTSLFFVLGLSFVFVMLGASATAVGQHLNAAGPILMRIAGVLLFILGIHMMGLFKIKFLMMEKRFQAKGGSGMVAAFIMGLAFAFGWTPCIGPILAGILTLAGNQQDVSKGVLLLVVYSAGLGIPFILAGLFINVFNSFFMKMQNYFRTIEIISGIVLCLIGILLLFGWFALALDWLRPYLPQTEVG